MTSLGLLCHFCDIHGPRILFCCQPYFGNFDELLALVTALDSEREADPNSDAEPSVNKLTFYEKLVNYLESVANADPTTARTSLGLSSASLNDTCLSCNSFDTLKPVFLTNDHKLKMSFVGSQYPYHPVIAIAKQACVRSLSCEVTESHNNEGHVFFGDDTNGYCLSHMFSLRDNKARGFRRRYSLCALSSQKMPLLNFYETLVRRLRRCAEQLQVHANDVSERESRTAGGDDPARMAGSGGQRLGWMPSGFVKERLGDGGAPPPRSFVDIVGDRRVFEKLQKFFVTTLKVQYTKRVTQVLDGTPCQDDLVRAERQEDNALDVENATDDDHCCTYSIPSSANAAVAPVDSYIKHRTVNSSKNSASPVAFGGDTRRAQGAIYRNPSEASVLCSSSSGSNLLRACVKADKRTVANDEDVSPSSSQCHFNATYVNGDHQQSCLNDSTESYKNLLTLYQIFGKEAFKILATHILVGDQLVVRADWPPTAAAVLGALSLLLPVGCRRVNLFSSAYVPPWQCNLLGLAADASPPAPDDGFFVMVTAKRRDDSAAGLQNTSGGSTLVQLDKCNFRLHHVGLPPDDYPSITDRLLSILSRFSQSNSPSRFQAFETCLRAIREEWVDKAKLYFRLSKRQASADDDLERRSSGFMKVAKVSKPIDLTVVKFIQAALSKQYKSYVISRIAEKLNQRFV